MHAGRGQESIGTKIRILTLSKIRLRPRTGVIKLINITFIKILTEPPRGEKVTDTTLIISHIKPQIWRKKIRYSSMNLCVSQPLTLDPGVIRFQILPDDLFTKNVITVESFPHLC